MWLSTAKNFLVGQPKIQSNEKRGRNPQNIGGLIGVLIIIFRRISDAAAFSLRVFLRRNLGERTFTIWTVILSFLWVWYFVSEGVHFKVLSSDFEFLEPIAKIINTLLSEGQERETERIIFFRSLDHILWYFYAFINFIYQALQYLDTFFQSLASPNYYPKASILSFYYSLVVIFLGVIAMIQNWKKSTITHEKMDSYYRGDSIFFRWLGLVNLRIKGSEIILDKAFIWLFVEPIAVLILALGLLHYGVDVNFALFLILSSGALFLEELREFQVSRGEVLDVVDGEFKAEKLERKLEKLDPLRSNLDQKRIGAVLSDRS